MYTRAFTPTPPVLQTMMTSASHIGVLAETTLHADLKTWYARPGDVLETKVDGFVIDIVRGDTLIEIQTRQFGALRRKLETLLPRHHVHVLHPIPLEQWIVRLADDGAAHSRRKSPKRGQLIDIFRELVFIPALLPHPNLTLEILLTQEETWLRNDGRGSWRRQRWSIHDRRLLAVVETAGFVTPADLCSLLPASLTPPFTNHELAQALGCRLSLAQKMSYTLRQAGVLGVAGKQGNALLYHRP